MGVIEDRYTLAHRVYPYARHADQDAAAPAHHQVAIIGAGPVGVALALDLGLRGVDVVVLDDHEGIGMGSRAICFAKRALEICDRLGAVGPMMDKGVVWNLGKVFHRDRKLYEFNLLPEDGHKFPAFINLQQPSFELALVERLRTLQAEGAPISLRGRNRVDGVEARDNGATLDIMTPDGPYQVTADWVVACDGAASKVRTSFGLPFEGQVFRDSFLIADIRMKADFPTERWFWFDPPHRGGSSTLLHRQPDDVWRVDFQIGWDADGNEERKPENIRRRLDSMLGDVEYEIVWSSIYTFQCKRMTSFRHGRVLFAGDAAHQVSPFGARGANSGIQDADNLGWKLALVLSGHAPEALIDSYDAERAYGADENILNSTRATDFITPKSEISHIFRDAVLALAEHNDFARPLVNSGRLSVPCVYDGSALNSADGMADGPARTRPGAPCPDAPLDEGFLLDRLDGRFTVLALGGEAPRLPEGLPDLDIALLHLPAPGAELRARYLGAASSGVYLIRPDQHVAARWPALEAGTLRAAFSRAIGMKEDATC